MSATRPQHNAGQEVESAHGEGRLDIPQTTSSTPRYTTIYPKHPKIHHGVHASCEVSAILPQHGEADVESVHGDGRFPAQAVVRVVSGLVAGRLRGVFFLCAVRGTRRSVAADQRWNTKTLTCHYVWEDACFRLRGRCAAPRATSRRRSRPGASARIALAPRSWRAASGGHPGRPPGSRGSTMERSGMGCSA